jgi:hypothetical protein
MEEPEQFEEGPPETRPFFAGDDWDQLREEQYQYRAGTLAKIAERIIKAYLRASVATGREDDAIALALRAGPPDDTPLTLAFTHLAAYWRYSHGHVTTVEAAHPFFDHLDHVLACEKWISDEVAAWFLDCPRLVRLAAILLVRPPLARPLAVEAELWGILQRRYPLPPPEQPDLLGDPRC